ncbi:hypothetical protein EMCRGX_G005019 [Ephydatia muelleri]
MDMEPEQEIENRSVRSGASKRKKRKEQLDEWNRLQSKLPRLLSFGFSIQNEPNHSSLQAGTLETAAAEHQCLDVVNNTHDSVNETEPSATMLAPSNDCSQSFQSYTLDTTVTTAAINDPAKWTVTDNLREYWALHGPTRCYNNDGRWDILHQYIGMKGIVVKQLSNTRWSARHDATKAFQNGYFEKQNALDALSDDSEHQQPDGMHLASVYSEGMNHLETVLLTDLWNAVLERFNKTSKSVQAEEIELGTVVTLLESLSSFLISLRSKFDEFERRTIGAALVKTYKDVNQRKQHSTRTSILLRCMEGINFE